MIYKLFILCEIIGGAAKPSRETSAIGFFGEHDIPESSLTRVTPGQVRGLFAHHRDPSLPTDFDREV